MYKLKHKLYSRLTIDIGFSIDRSRCFENEPIGDRIQCYGKSLVGLTRRGHTRVASDVHTRHCCLNIYGRIDRSARRGRI